MNDSERLKELLAERGLTQRELAAMLGVSAQYVNQLCNGRAVSDRFIGRLARTLGAAAAAAVTGGAEAKAKVAVAAEATGIAFPPIELYHEVARPGLYEAHLFDALLFDNDVARRQPGARRRWTTDELVHAALVACGVLRGSAGAGERERGNGSGCIRRRWKPGMCRLAKRAWCMGRMMRPSS